MNSIDFNKVIDELNVLIKCAQIKLNKHPHSLMYLVHFPWVIMWYNEVCKKEGCYPLSDDAKPAYKSWLNIRFNTSYGKHRSRLSLTRYVNTVVEDYYRKIFALPKPEFDTLYGGDDEWIFVKRHR